MAPAPPSASQIKHFNMSMPFWQFSEKNRKLVKFADLKPDNRHRFPGMLVKNIDNNLSKSKL